MKIIVINIIKLNDFQNLNTSNLWLLNWCIIYLMKSITKLNFFIIIIMLSIYNYNILRILI